MINYPDLVDYLSENLEYDDLDLNFYVTSDNKIKLSKIVMATKSFYLDVEPETNTAKVTHYVKDSEETNNLVNKLKEEGVSVENIYL